MENTQSLIKLTNIIKGLIPEKIRGCTHTNGNGKTFYVERVPKQDTSDENKIIINYMVVYDGETLIEYDRHELKKFYVLDKGKHTPEEIAEQLSA